MWGCDDICNQCPSVTYGVVGGGRVRVIIPSGILSKMNHEQRELILAHELAHVRRRDHFVRWVEWLCCVCFWWNPVIWLAQRKLRAAEEICCDEMVVSSLNSKPKYYANTLFSIVEFLAHPDVRPPAMASEINSGGSLERRFLMIVSNEAKRLTTGRMQLLVLLLALIVLPLGMAYAQDKSERGKRSGLRQKYAAAVEKINAAVEAGEITEEEAETKIAALRERIANASKERGDKDGVMRERYQAAVEAGELTEEEAEQKIEAMKHRIRSAGQRGELRRR